MPSAYAPDQLLFPFMGEVARPAVTASVLLRLPRAAKEALAERARAGGLSVTAVLNDLIRGFLAPPPDPPPRKKTGRGNVDEVQVGLVKRFLRESRQQGVTAAQVAAFVREGTGVECSRARAERLLDLLSGHCAENANTATDFLVYEDDLARPPRFFIAKDAESGIV